jgi:hypothetical protein
MAINPNPDHVSSMMMQNFGTKYLITNPKSDYYLNLARKKINEPPLDRYSRPCGGKNGFDDYVERWHN